MLGGYRNRYQAIADAVTETEPSFDEAKLADTAVVDLLCEPVYSLADRWRDGAEQQLSPFARRGEVYPLGRQCRFL